MPKKDCGNAFGGALGSADLLDPLEAARALAIDLFILEYSLLHENRRFKLSPEPAVYYILPQSSSQLCQTFWTSSSSSMMSSSFSIREICSGSVSFW